MAEGRVRFRATGHPAEVAAGRLTLRVIRDPPVRRGAFAATVFGDYGPFAPSLR